MPEIRYCTPALLSLIRDVVKNTNTPSWFNKKNSVPYNFGDESTGTLKADEWRSYSTVYLPLALMKAWGAGSVHDSRYEETIFRVALDHTMMLGERHYFGVLSSYFSRARPGIPRMHSGISGALYDIVHCQTPSILRGQLACGDAYFQFYSFIRSRSLMVDISVLNDSFIRCNR